MTEGARSNAGLVALALRGGAVLACLGFGAACDSSAEAPDPGRDGDEGDEGDAEPTRRDLGSKGGDPGPSPLAFPRMGTSVYHPAVNLFTTGMSGEEVGARVRQIKKLAFGEGGGSPCYFGPDGVAQLAVHTEFTVREYVSLGETFDALDERLDAIIEEGVAVHLLLPLHYVEQLGDWQGVAWSSETSWSNYTPFAPMKPCAQAWEDGVRCPYDVIFEHFQLPVIEHLVATGRAEKLAVIYVANEFGYDPTQIRDASEDWGGAVDWKRKRAEALAYTAGRALGGARTAAEGRVLVGLKFVDVVNTNTGWTPEPGVIGDQLAYMLNDVMGPAGDVVGYDAFFSDSGFDLHNRGRLAPFLPMFSGGRFAITEYARVCAGLPGELVSGERTRGEDIPQGAAAWSSARGINLFSFNAHPLDEHSGCCALTDPADHEVVYPGAAETAAGLWAQVVSFTGSDEPSRCTR